MRESHSSCPAICMSTETSVHRQMALAGCLGPLHAFLSTTIIALASQSSLPSQRHDALHPFANADVNNSACARGSGTSSSSSSSSLLCGLLRGSGSLQKSSRALPSNLSIMLSALPFHASMPSLASAAAYASWFLTSLQGRPSIRRASNGLAAYSSTAQSTMLEAVNIVVAYAFRACIMSEQSYRAPLTIPTCCAVY